MMSYRFVSTIRSSIFKCKKPINLSNTNNIYESFKFSTDKPHQPVTKQINSPEFEQIFTTGLKNLKKIFEKHNFELRIVGDPVLDLLLHKQPETVDLASPATPEQMKKILTQEKVLILKSKSDTHGNVSLQIDDQPFKVSTLRTDTKSTSVNFTTDWYLDARRRDLTVGAMYLGLDGTLYDYFNGIEDLEKKRIRFVGNPSVRIKEDYFRIMRYFRYSSLIGNEANNLDADILKIIKTNAKRLNEISGNKIWSEVSKILSGNLKFQLLRKMLEVGLADPLGIPKNYDVNELDALEKRTEGLELHPITILTSLLRSDDDMVELNQRMKLTKLDRDLGFFIIKHRNIEKKDILQYFKETFILSTTSQSNLRFWIRQVLSYRGDADMLKEFEDWRMPPFPVKSQQLLDYGLKKGSQSQVVMTAMKKRWIQSSFELTESDLLAKFHEIVREIESGKNVKSKSKGK